MNRSLLVALLTLCVRVCYGQSIDDLNLQVHGYATQGFLYSTNNNWNTTNSSDGSSAWMEAVVNLTAQPQSKLRIGVQARYFLLGAYGNAITLDWAQADYKINERVGFRAGKVKTPAGMLNETQDVDPGHLWILLPQSIYPLASRNSTLSHFGGVVYGSVPLTESLGRIEYRVYGGQRVVAADDGYLQPFRDEGLSVPGGLAGRVYGGTMRWELPTPGLMIGASLDSERPSGSIAAGPYVGAFSTTALRPYYLFGRFERTGFMLAGEYSRLATQALVQFTGAPGTYTYTDRRAFYVMASYKLGAKTTGGMYYSSTINRGVMVSDARYQKDWTLSARYDVNPYLYLKAEQHFTGGTEIGYSTLNNTVGLKPNARMTLLKLGVSF